MELLIYRLVRVAVISVRYFCLISDVPCNFVWFTRIYQMYIYCINFFLSLFLIPSQTVIDKILPNLCSPVQYFLQLVIVTESKTTTSGLLPGVLTLPLHPGSSFPSLDTFSRINVPSLWKIKTHCHCNMETEDIRPGGFYKAEMLP